MYLSELYVCHWGNKSNILDVRERTEEVLQGAQRGGAPVPVPGLLQGWQAQGGQGCPPQGQKSCSTGTQSFIIFY